MADGEAVEKKRYLVDHGLERDEYKSLYSNVRDALKHKPLNSSHWQLAYLPLLVCAVEVGYDYQGNGTDYWPTLSTKLGYEFSVDDRKCLSNLFAQASEKFGGVTPGQSQWERAFCHIAWPITHAVASRDIRRPFADCLRQFSHDVRNDTLEDETIVSDLSRISTSVGSRRFRIWLGRQDVVAGSFGIYLTANRCMKRACSRSV